MRAKTLVKGAFDPDSYEFNESFTPGDTDSPLSCKTLHEVVECLEKKSEVSVSGTFLEYSRQEKRLIKRKLTRSKLIESFRNNEAAFRESGIDAFGTDANVTDIGAVGQDYIPILGGPFHKQLYTYDFLKASAAAFWAVNHDPMARRIVETIVHFTLGKGFRINFKDPRHSALWDAFEDVNNFYEQFYYFGRELSTYGESMWYWLPNKETKISFGRDGEDAPTTGIIPRIRVIDPTMVWDYITWPEDITDVLAYQIVSPMQYQIYTKVDGQDKTVPGTKFVMQQLPADAVIHQRINCMSNEKRGRSDLFSILGYLKRLRDSVNYSLVALQKTAAWAIDTTIEGSQSDLDGYVADQQAQGTIAPAGSEFVHTAKVTRKFLANEGSSRGGGSQTFEWCLSMIAAGSGIPTQYFGTHLQGGQTRASAVVGIEPVARLFEMRQRQYEITLNKIIKHFFRANGINDVDFVITWPEIITQDRSQKLKDLAMAQTMRWVSPKRAGNMAAKEFGQDDYVWDSEQDDIKSEQSAEPPMQTSPAMSTGGVVQPDKPLTKPGVVQDSSAKTKPSAVTGPEKAQIKRNYGT